MHVVVFLYLCTHIIYIGMSLNKVMLIGNVGAEPDVRYVEQGVAMATIRLATTRRGYTLKNGTEVPEQTEWHEVLMWRRLAETAEKYVHKGDKLYIEGSIHTRTYDDKNGIRRYRTEVWAESMELLSPPKQQRDNSVSEAPSRAQSASPEVGESLPF